MNQNNKTEEPLFSILSGLPSSLLNTRDTQQTSSQTLIVIGPTQSGKTKMLSALNGQPEKSQSVGLLYSYLRTTVAGQRSVLQLYEVSGQAFKHLQTLPVTKLNYNSVTYVLVVDLGDNPPEILSSVNQAIEELRSQQEKHLQKLLTPSEYQELEQRSYTQIASHADRVKLRPLLLPLVIVGWKQDLFSKNLDVEVRKWLSRGLRYMALINNATLVFGNQNDSSMVKQGLTNPNSKINQSDHMKMVYVGRGVDTIDQISLPMMSTQSIQPIEAIQRIIKEQVVVNPNPQKKAQKKQITQEEWDQYKEEKIDRVKREKDKSNQ